MLSRPAFHGMAWHVVQQRPPHVHLNLHAQVTPSSAAARLTSEPACRPAAHPTEGCLPSHTASHACSPLALFPSKLCGCVLIDIIDYNDYLRAFAPLWPTVRAC